MQDPQLVWNEYFERIKQRRITEAKLIWDEMSSNGVNEETILALDFTHFSENEENAKELENQLKENYEITINKSDENDYWYINGTTRPYGINLSQSSCLDWVEFMCDVARSHGCVFSNWSLEAPALKQSWSTEEYDTE